MTRVVVCALGGATTPWELPASIFGERPHIRGGERTLYEIAFASAAAGFDTELRGSLVRDAFDSLATSTDVAPSTHLPQRVPEPDDIVVVPEAWPPVQIARLVLSPARKVMMMLAPPGLFGWAFDSLASKLPDPLTVDVKSVGRAESFRAAAELGFTLWSHSKGIVGAVNAAGTSCAYVGTGNPQAFPTPGEKTHDVALVDSNRWAPLAREVASHLSDLTHVVIPDVPNAELILLLGAARVLLWPSRIEGHSRIQVEARAMGCVPVALSTNVYADGLDESGGAVLVDSIEAMPEAVRGLLADRKRWRKLSGRAMSSARDQVAWEPFVVRVSDAIGAVGRDARAEASALAQIGAEIDPYFRRAAHTDTLETVLDQAGAEAKEREQRLADLNSELSAIRGSLAESREEAGKLRDEIEMLRDELVARRSERDRIEAELREQRRGFDNLRNRRAVRLLLELDRMMRRVRPPGDTG